MPGSIDGFAAQGLRLLMCGIAKAGVLGVPGAFSDGQGRIKHGGFLQKWAVKPL
jgi:hypothetical protein